ncbi:hypothetical protein EXU85_03705 [Spirosoma sp. KCTC 42546]|uniref:hypothetical protein n=1 Tax=Spirosoma sp. KCTC 42546 TaxID=2520506 RepID=UPI001159B0B1|nr:hypothetical protein [Spirosoma sp. KCTC 42546]QDK77747.1 hypothetical protein EXU85_03705 [Spirosoma sp. KCTC 42546]
MQVIDDRRAAAQRKYGFDVGKTGALLLLEVDEVGSRYQTLIQQATAGIRESQQPLQTDNPKAAFWYGVGRNGVWTIPIMLTIAIVSWFYSQQQSYQAIKATLDKYPNAAEFQFLMQLGQLERSEDGALNLILRAAPSKGTIEAGKHYVYNSDCKCVKVPLHY